MEKQKFGEVTQSSQFSWANNFEVKKSRIGAKNALFQLLKSAIERGKLRAGDRLPTHRKLAQHLGVAVATVTKVYKLAESNGLVVGKAGNGCFVSTCPLSSNAIQAGKLTYINLSIIKPVAHYAELYLQKHLSDLSQHHQLSDLMEYNAESGSLTDIQTAKLWLTSQGKSFNNREVSICSGAQHGLMILITTLTQQGDCIAVEAHCYPGIIALAQQFGRKLVPIELDEEGMIPSSLDKQCQLHDVKLVIAVASHQNPTTAVMSIERRKHIASIIEQYKLWLIDDDVYGFLSNNLPELSSFIPERSFYLTSLSKALLPGLRVGYLTYPQSFKARIDAAIRNTVWMPVPLTLSLASKLIHSGDADKLITQQIETAKNRQQIVRNILGAYTLHAKENSFHVWLKLPEQWSAEKFCEVAKAKGVLISNNHSFLVGPRSTEEAIRISIMAVKSIEELRFGLEILKGILDNDGRL